MEKNILSSLMKFCNQIEMEEVIGESWVGDDWEKVFAVCGCSKCF